MQQQLGGGGCKADMSAGTAAVQDIPERCYGDDEDGCSTVERCAYHGILTCYNGKYNKSHATRRGRPVLIEESVKGVWSSLSPQGWTSIQARGPRGPRADRANHHNTLGCRQLPAQVGVTSTHSYCPSAHRAPWPSGPVPSPVPAPTPLPPAAPAAASSSWPLPPVRRM